MGDGLQIQRNHLATLCGAGLAGDDLGLTLLLRQHEVPVFDVARYDAAFSNPADAVRDLMFESLNSGAIPGARQT